MDQFPPNSHKAKDVGEKNIQSVVVSQAQLRKKPLGRRFAETFVEGEARSVWSYVALDVLLPAFKDMVLDAITTGASRMMFGDSRSPTSRALGGGAHTPYGRISTLSSRGPSTSNLSDNARANHNFGEIVLSTRVECEEVIDRMWDVIQTYDIATVKDLYKFCNLPSNYTDDKWGWDAKAFQGPRIENDRNGYRLNLPRPVPIN